MERWAGQLRDAGVPRFTIENADRAGENVRQDSAALQATIGEGSAGKAAVFVSLFWRRGAAAAAAQNPCGGGGGAAGGWRC